MFRLRRLNMFQYSLRTLCVVTAVVAIVLAVTQAWKRQDYVALLIDCDIPNTEVYAGPMYLGRTPLRLSSRQVANLRLGEPAPHLDWALWVPPAEGGALLKSPRGPGTLIWLKAPRNDSLISTETPWGTAIAVESLYKPLGASKWHIWMRARRVGDLGNRIVPRLDVPKSISTSSKSAKVALVLENRSGNPWDAAAQSIRITAWLGTFTDNVNSVTFDKDIPVTFTSIAPNAKQSLEFEIPTPNVPGEYRLHVGNIKVDGVNSSKRDWPGSTPCAVLRVK